MIILAVVSRSSLKERALFQATQFQRLAKDLPEDFMLILTKPDFQVWLSAREVNPDFVVGLIGTEGSHALDGDLANINILFDADFRMMSRQYFFDNKLGSSLHGSSYEGLTVFGKQALKMMQNKDIIVDVSHSSEGVVRDKTPATSLTFGLIVINLSIVELKRTND